MRTRADLIHQKNPAYKGKWPVPRIDNPAYKGVWAPKKIKNPGYYSDKTPANFEPIGAIGFEIWTMQKDIMFDNIYIGHSREDADKLKAETWDIKQAIEEKEKEASKPEPPTEDAAGITGTFLEDPVAFVKAKVELFIELVKEDPVNAIKSVPEVSGSIGAILAILITLLLGTGGAAAASSPAVQNAAKKAKDSAVDAKDKAAEAVATGAEKAQAEINKRTTRSADKADS